MRVCGIILIVLASICGIALTLSLLTSEVSTVTRITLAIQTLGYGAIGIAMVKEGEA